MSQETSATPSSSPQSLLGFAVAALIGAAVGVAGVLAFTGGMGSGGGDAVVAEFNGNKVKGSEVFSKIQTRIFDLEDEIYRTKLQAINDYIESNLLKQEMEKQKLSLDQLLDKEVGGEEAEITDKDIVDFMESKNLSLDDPRIRKDDVRDYLKYKQKFEKRQAFLDRLKSQANTKILLAEPDSPTLQVNTEGYPSWGNKNAKVTIVEFSDFQCPFCSRALPVLADIKKNYGPDKVRIVFRDMPLPSHNRAEPAALASHCADEQGKFWEYHDVLFSNQTNLGDDALKKFARDLQLDEKKFNECFTSKAHIQKVEASKREAEALGIGATPSFIINGRLLQGAQPFEKFKERIDRELQKS